MSKDLCQSFEFWAATKYFFNAGNGSCRLFDVDCYGGGRCSNGSSYQLLGISSITAHCPNEAGNSRTLIYSSINMGNLLLNQPSHHSSTSCSTIQNVATSLPPRKRTPATFLFFCVCLSNNRHRLFKLCARNNSLFRWRTIKN
jgi:hypothetical protein